MGFDHCEAFRERLWLAEPRSLDRETFGRRNTRGILKDRRYVAIAAVRIGSELRHPIFSRVSGGDVARVRYPWVPSGALLDDLNQLGGARRGLGELGPNGARKLDPFFSVAQLEHCHSTFLDLFRAGRRLVLESFPLGGGGFLRGLDQQA